jgi:hypothetical protein
MASNNSIIFSVAIAALLTTIIVLHHREKNELIQNTQTPTTDTVCSIDTAAIHAIQQLTKVDRIIKSDKSKDSIIMNDKIKEEALVRQGRHIKDSITEVDRHFSELKRRSEYEKIELKKKYEKHIDEIYKTNCLARGGPEDTIKTSSYETK